MDVLDKATILLREYLKKNKEQVSADLDELRRISDGDCDIYSYLNNFQDNNEEAI